MTSAMERVDSVWPSMQAHGQPHLESTQPKFTPVNSYLQTPEGPTFDSFSYEEKPQDATQAWQTTSKLPPIQQPATPPTSPLPSIVSATGFSKDGPLFPEFQTDRSQTPLFLEPEPSPSVPAAQPVPTQPVTAAVSRPSSPSPSMGSIWSGIITSRAAREYYNSRRNELRLVPRVRLPKPNKSSSPERDMISTQQVQRLSRPSGVSKPQSQPRPTPRPRASVATSSVQRTTPTPRRRTPARSRTNSDFLNDAWPQSQPAAKHKRAPASKKVEDHRHWSELPDYAPPTDSLDIEGRHLKASWDSGNKKDLSQDDERRHLHPQELELASTLRLDCAKYLLSKRQIFQARLQALKDQKTGFTKTAAQSACGIDVNKASKLWEAFSAVGWFNEELFKKFL